MTKWKKEKNKVMDVMAKKRRRKNIEESRKKRIK